MDEAQIDVISLDDKTRLSLVQQDLYGLSVSLQKRADACAEALKTNPITRGKFPIYREISDTHITSMINQFLSLKKEIEEMRAKSL